MNAIPENLDFGRKGYRLVTSHILSPLHTLVNGTKLVSLQCLLPESSQAVLAGRKPRGQSHFHSVQSGLPVPRRHIGVLHCGP